MNGLLIICNIIHVFFSITFLKEKLHSAVRRYESPEEHAFFPALLPQRSDSMEKLDYPNLLSSDPAIDALNWNPILYEKYLNVIVPAIARKGDDEQYGSTCVTDTAALQALSKRIHYGKFVAESKYRSNPEGFQRLVDAGDADGVMALLTNAKVEEQVLTRARLKATTYGREPMLSSFPMTRNAKDGDSTAIIAAAAAMAVVAAVEAMQDSKENGDKNDKIKGKVDPAIIEAIYRELIIPMTKDIEVAYLFLRCGREPPKEYAPDRMSVDVTTLTTR
jgi:chorismate mutase